MSSEKQLTSSVTISGLHRSPFIRHVFAERDLSSQGVIAVVASLSGQEVQEGRGSSSLRGW